MLTKYSVEKYFLYAAGIAKKAKCRRAKCGAVILHDDLIIGEGNNSPPGSSKAKCSINLGTDGKHDRTCCVHAEWRAIIDAAKNHPALLSGSDLVFCRVDLKDKNIVYSGKPYCTICSRLALDVGIKGFWLLHKDGPKRYDTKKYNNLSYKFKRN